MEPNWNALKGKYEEMSEWLITDVNATPVTLYYPPQTELSSVDTPFTDRPNIVDEYGGRAPLNSFPGRQDQDGSNLSIVPTSETLTCRVYFASRSMDDTFRQIMVNSTKNYCKIITYSEFGYKLKNASYVEIDGDKYRLIKDPVKFGLLGSKQWCVSYWEQQ